MECCVESCVSEGLGRRARRRALSESPSKQSQSSQCNDAIMGLKGRVHGKSPWLDYFKSLE